MSTLERYLTICAKRLRTRYIARSTAAIAGTVLALTAVFAFLFIMLVPSAGWVIAIRVLLYIMLAAAIALTLWWPFKPSTVVAEVEKRTAKFDGRLRTWRDATERDGDSTLLTLLTRQTEAVAQDQHPNQIVQGKEIAIPAALGAVTLIMLIALLTTGTSPWQLAGQRLWTGDLFTSAAPRITVSPGDMVVPRGADVVVEAATSGFTPRNMAMHATFEQTDGWETAPMSRLGTGKYGFVFVGLTEKVEYYVGAQGLNSERHVIHVVDLPRVTGVNLTYAYPDWTGLADTERADGDVAALAGTEVRIQAHTDLPVEDPLIVVNGEVIEPSTEASADGLVTNGVFEVAEAGSWHVAVRHEGTLARISDSYFIDVVEDNPPEVSYTFPGHDGQATPVEEVTLRFTAEDDFGVNHLTFNYSVNGGAWVQAEMEIDAAETLLVLEDLRIPNPLDDAVEAQRTLRPGDMIAFYAEAKDHTQQARTALYFVDVRPFDRVYRESQSSPSQGGGGGGLEIADRQREILSATWNLINSTSDEPADNDQIDVLALLQRTLKSQVTTLIERASARRLTIDEQIDTFTTELTLATDYMEPAAEHLDGREVQEAIAPQQQALQHLIAAQATSDIDVSTGQVLGRGIASRSLSELMDLELDTEKNRYETPQSPSQNDAAQQQDDEWQRIEKLAARAEQLAEQQRRGEESVASRWQQERLQRELEELQEQLSRGQRSREGLSREGEGQQNNQQMQNAIAELNKARQAMDQSLQQPDNNQNREATGQALRRAADQFREHARGNLQERLNRTDKQVANLLNDQRNIMDRLNDLQREALNPNSPDTLQHENYAMEPYAERKRRMHHDLNEVAREITAVGESVNDEDTQRVLEQAISELADDQVDERLSASANAFEYGQPLYAVGNEAFVENALSRLGDRLDQAQRLLAASDAQDQDDDSLLAQVRTLRQALNASGDGDDRGEINRVRRAADNLEFRLGQEQNENFARDTTSSRQTYTARGTDEANSDALVQMLRDRLDLIEAALLQMQAAPIRAQEPRDEGRDSEAAARYFRGLSRSEG